jgi:hypothetical protein
VVLTDRRLVLAVVALGALGSLALAPTPTSTRGSDLVLTALGVALFGALASVSRPAALIVAATIAAAAGGTTGTVLAIAALAVAAAFPTPLGAAASGALLGNALLDLRWPEATRGTALLAAACVAIVLFGAWGRLPRRKLALAAAGAVGLALVLSLGAAVAAAQERSRLLDAVDAGEAGLQAARRGDPDAAQVAFEAANRELEASRRTFRRWWVRPALVVPVVGQHIRAVDELTGWAGAVTDEGRKLAAASDPAKMRTPAGDLDLAAIGALGEPLESLRALLTGTSTRLARATSPWLLPLVRDEMQTLQQRSDEARADLADASVAVQQLPLLLGKEGTQRYFLAMMTPSEQRGGGGFIGNWGILTATDGRLELPRFGRIRELYRNPLYRIDVSPDWNARVRDGWGVARYPQNVLGSPDFPSNAEAIRQITRQAGEGEIDGVIAIDPIGLAALLALTGPVTVDGWPEPLTSANTAKVLLHDQYLAASGDDRELLLQRVTQAIFGKLTSIPPVPDTIANALGPVVRAGHVQATVFDASSSDFLDDVGASHRVPDGPGELLFVTAANTSASKLDWFLRRSITYDVTTSVAGATTANVTVRLRNLADGSLPADYFGSDVPRTGPGWVRQLVTLHTGMTLQKATVDGEPVTNGIGRDVGTSAYDLAITLPPGAERTAVFELRGAPLGGAPFAFNVHPHATAWPDEVIVRIDGREVHRGVLDRPTTFRSR